jgi:hypothetical protein
MRQFTICNSVITHTSCVTLVFIVLQIFVHDTLESLYKQVDMELLPTDYLPDDYTGPSAGSVAELVGRLISLSYITKTNRYSLTINHDSFLRLIDDWNNMKAA